MTNRERVLALIRSEPDGITDSEIRKRTGIRPHQQVNQICRKLAQAGLTLRQRGKEGLLVNLRASSPRGNQPNERSVPGTRPSAHSLRRARSSEGDEIPPLSIPRTLFVLPCSGAKEEGGRRAAGHQPSILDSLPRRLAEELVTKRSANRRAAKVNDVALLPAAARYSGTLYREAGHAIDGLHAAGAHSLIISGGYGVVLPAEPIGWYNQEYRNAMWPDALVPRCLSAYAEATRASSVVGLLSATTQYARAFRAARWPVEIENVFFACPEPKPGAMVKTPRAIGEALVALSRDHRLRPGWKSSDGLAMQVAKLK